MIKVLGKHVGAALAGASNRLVAIEELSEQELEVLQRRFRELAEKAHGEADMGTSRSVDDKPER